MSRSPPQERSKYQQSGIDIARDNGLCGIARSGGSNYGLGEAGDGKGYGKTESAPEELMWWFTSIIFEKRYIAIRKLHKIKKNTDQINNT